VNGVLPGNVRLTGQEYVVTMVLSRVRAFHSGGPEHETLGTVAYHTAVRVRACPSVAYAGHLLTLVDVYRNRGAL